MQGSADRVYGFTEETRKIIGEKSAATIRTPEWCAKIGAKHKGKKISAEQAKGQSERMTGYKWKQEHIDARTAGQKSSEKFKKRYKPVIIDGVRYESEAGAQEKLGIPGSTLKYRLIAEKWVNYSYA